jgi:hypothetical protein
MGSDHTVDRVAEWLDGVDPADGAPPPEVWACVEIFGHRKHYGRVREVDRFATKMLRIDVPLSAGAPLLGEAETFETFMYGGAAIFSLTPMTEEAARKWAQAERPKPYRPLDRLPSPDGYSGRYDDEEETPF